MRFSVVTISFNQAEFLERAIRSVLDQRGEGIDVEYIMVDPGSTDGSHDIIERYRPELAQVLLDPDKGPADGLNKGFAKVTGDICCYINSDDAFEPGAFATVRDYFEAHPEVDVVCGHAWITDRNDHRLRRLWSGRIDRVARAYNASNQVQPSTFIRAAALAKVQFNIANRSNWDDELITDLSLAGARIRRIDAFLSSYRLHGDSITNSGKILQAIQNYWDRRFETLMGRKPGRSDRWIGKLVKLRERLIEPHATWERMRRGPIFRRGSD